jgi:hypothetical protein
METATLSKSVVIVISVVTSSSVVLILLFFIFGFICGCCFKQKKYSKNKTSDGDVNEIEPYPKVTALYEDILPNLTCTQQNLEMEQNAAYGSAKQ